MVYKLCFDKEFPLKQNMVNYIFVFSGVFQIPLLARRNKAVHTNLEMIIFKLFVGQHLFHLTVLGSA